MGATRILVFEHHPLEHAGSYWDALADSGIKLQRVRSYAGEDPPPLLPCDGLIVMGGPMSVRDRAAHPWLEAELALVKEALSRELPLLGVCLGSQMLAVAAGAQLTVGDTAEIGWYEVRLTPAASADPLFRNFPQVMSVFQWHREGFTLPPGAVLLAASNAFPVQAFRVGEKAYGFLFHLEVNRAMVAAWRGAFVADAATLAEPRSETNYAAINDLAGRVAKRLFLS